MTEGNSRIPGNADGVDSDDVATRQLLDHARGMSGGRLLNMHWQMATAPAVLAGYLGLRDAIFAHATVDRRTRSAVAIAASGATQGRYTLAVNSNLALRESWAEPEIWAIAQGDSCGDARLDALLEVARCAATGDGSVPAETWRAALAADWDVEQLAEVFAYVGLVTYCERFVHYADTQFDVVPARPA